MSDPIDFDNPTREQAKQFQKNLFKQLLFEPVSDLDYVRPAAKLRSLVEDSEAMMKRLNAVWNKYDELLTSLRQLSGIVEEIKPVFDPLLSVALGPHPPNYFRYAVPMPGVSIEEYDQGHALFEQQERVRSLAQRLSVLFHSSISPNDVILTVRITGSQLTAGQFWAFFWKITEHVAKGNRALFERHLLPENLKELLSDATDKAIENAELPNPLPLVHFFTTVLAFIRRKERREQAFEEFTGDMDAHVFLSSYFSWWTDGDGRKTVEGIVGNSEKTLQSHDEAVQSLLTQSQELIGMLAEFKTLSRELVDRLRIDEHGYNTF